jgi:hypothetical protein
VSKLPGAFSNALSSLGVLPYRGDEQSDLESLEDKTMPLVDEPPKLGKLKTVFRNHVKDIGLLSSATTAFMSSGQKNRQRRLKVPRRHHIDTAAHSEQTTRLNLPLKPSESLDFTRYGKIKDTVYSEDGCWLAVTW